jgi:biotin carboxyl carrier protein
MRFEAHAAGRSMTVEVKDGGHGRYTVTLDGRVLEIEMVETGTLFASLLANGRSDEVGIERRNGRFRIHFADESVAVELTEATPGIAPTAHRHQGPFELKAPMPGRIVRVLTEVGQAVEAGQGLIVIEAMKMENELRCPRDGQVSEVRVQEGQAVETGAPLLVVT